MTIILGQIHVCNPTYVDAGETGLAIYGEISISMCIKWGIGTPDLWGVYSGKLRYNQDRE